MYMSVRWRAHASVVVLVALCTAITAGCGSSDSGDTSATAPAKSSSTTGSKAAVDGKGIGVAMIGYANGNLFSDALTRAAKDEAARIGATFTAFDGKFNPGVQMKACQDAISSGRYKVIVLGAVSGVAAVPCATAANAAKITLVQVGTAIGTDNSSLGATVDGVTTSVNNPLDNYTAGVADQVGKACAGLDPCKVVELSVVQTIPDIEKSFQKRFKQVLADNPNIKVVATPEAGFDAGGGQKAMQDVLSKGVKFNVLVSNAEQGIAGAVIALKSAGKKLGTGEGEIRVVTEGGSKAQVAAVRNKYGVRYGVMAAKGQPVKRGYDANVLAKIPNSLDQQTIAKYPNFTGEW